MQLIPAIDLFQGQCVRLYQGDFARKTCYPRPETVLHGYRTCGAHWVHIVDLDGARSGKRYNHAAIAGLAASTDLKLQVGGGVRSPTAVEVLLEAGAARVVVGSAAIESPGEVQTWLELFGPERVCLAFDVRISRDEEPRIYTQGWAQPQPLTLWDALAPYSDLVRHVLCTDIARDGTLSGPNVELYAEAVSRFPQLAWQASGGVRNAQDLGALKQTGVAAAISGRALLENRITSEELRPFLPDASSPASTFATAGS